MELKLHHSSIVSKVLRLLFFSILSTTPFATCFAFEVHDYPAANPTKRIIDPEFDNVNFRALWQDSNNNLWISKIDQFTGGFTGENTLIASGLAPVGGANSNGPEWVYSPYETGPSIVYTIPDNNNQFRVKIAKETVPGDGNNDDWIVSDLDNMEGGFNTLGTHEENLGAPRIVYYKVTPNGTKVYWRNLYAPETETLISNGKIQSHFSLDGQKIAITQPCEGGNGTLNPGILDIDTNVKRCVKKTILTAGFPHVLYPDEFNNTETMMYTLEDDKSHRIIVVDQAVKGSWNRIKTIEAQDPMEPYITSPEPFVANGKQYVVYAALSVPAVKFYYTPKATGSIWIASLNPQDPLHRKITPDITAQRYEPEALTTSGNKIIIYYNYTPNNANDPNYSKNPTAGQLRIAETGL